MAAETAATRIKTRRVKDHILDRYLKMAEKVDKEGGKDNLTKTELSEYEKRSDQFASNCIPRTQEVTGEDGGAVQVTMVKYGEITKQVDEGVQGQVEQGVDSEQPPTV